MKKSASIHAPIELPAWINAPKKSAEPTMCVSIEVVEELQDDLKNAKQDRNMFALIAVVFLIGDVWLSCLLGVW